MWKSNDFFGTIKPFFYFPVIQSFVFCMKQQFAWKKRNFVQITKFTLAFIYRIKLREHISVQMCSLDFKFMAQSDSLFSFILFISINISDMVKSYYGYTLRSESFVQNNWFKIVFFLSTFFLYH